MLIKKPSDIKPSEITDPKVYLNRRLFMRGAILAGSAVATGLIYRQLNPPPAVIEERPRIAGLVTPHEIKGLERARWPYTTLYDIMRPLVVSPAVDKAHRIPSQVRRGTASRRPHIIER